MGRNVLLGPNTIPIRMKKQQAGRHRSLLNQLIASASVSFVEIGASEPPVVISIVVVGRRERRFQLSEPCFFAPNKYPLLRELPTAC